MSVAEEPGIQAISRVYCYLRLHGLTPDAAWRCLADLIAGADADSELWPQAMRWLRRHPLSAAGQPRPHPSPAILRGQIGFDGERSD